MSLATRLLNAVRPDALERELDEEVRFHLEMRIERLIASGLAAPEARARAYERFGDVRQVKAAMRRARQSGDADEAIRIGRRGTALVLAMAGHAGLVLLALATIPNPFVGPPTFSVRAPGSPSVKAPRGRNPAWIATISGAAAANDAAVVAAAVLPASTRSSAIEQRDRANSRDQLEPIDRRGPNQPDQADPPDLPDPVALGELAVWLPGAATPARWLPPRQPVTSTPDTAPLPVREAKPRYTPAALVARIQGAVLLECTVSADGRCTEIRVVHSLDPTLGLDEEAVRAASEWRFRPATRAGRAVPSVVQISLNFNLR